ncbi:MAG: primosomal protein N' [Ruminococcaceae bacterium]|nr:primosomal protein N' [Oscillospiraceae bacterium]
MKNNTFYKVGVYILDQVYTADIAYTYKASSEKATGIFAGTLVGLPFGGGNRLVYGIAINRPVDEIPPEEQSKYKEIEAVVDSRYALTEEMMGLCAYIKQQVLCTFGEAAALCLPKGLEIKTEEFYTKGERYHKFSEYLCTVADPSEFKELSALFEELENKGDAICESSAVSSAVSKKIVKKNTRLVYNVNERTEKHVKLISPEIADKILGKTTRKNHDKYEKVVNYLKNAENNSARIGLLSAIYSVPPSVFSTLEKNCAVSIYRQPLYRDASVNYSCEPSGKSFNLSPAQKTAYDALEALYDSGEAKAALLYGVTGSGKTGVILNLCDKALSEGKSVIYLVPEISLTGQTARLMFERYGDKVAIMHSALSQGERHDAWCAVKNGEKRIILGTRSAIFMPCRDLGLIVIDEEQDDSYKSDTAPKYHTRDIARFRCASNKALMLLASATPSVESFYKAQEGIYSLVRLDERYGDAVLPDVIIQDIREDLEEKPDRLIGKRLREELEKNLNDSKQSVLFINRRGFNSFISCSSCGEAVKCPNCSVTLTVHGNSKQKLMCHYCGYTLPYPKECPSCGSPHLSRHGSGTEKLEAELHELFPAARVVRMDADSTSEKNSHQRILGEFGEGGADILIGTQMVAKGHDFPAVTLVGVILAENSLYISDFRANERTFSLLTQVIGRAGRGSDKGRAVIQTLVPLHEIFPLAAQQDYDEFYKGEIAVRRAVGFPPVCDLCVVTLHSSNESQLLKDCAKLEKYLSSELEKSDCKMMVFGPMDAPIYKMRNIYRRRFIIKFKNNKNSRELFNKILMTFTKTLNKDVKLTLDINPTVI